MSWQGQGRMQINFQNIIGSICEQRNWKQQKLIERKREKRILEKRSSKCG